MYSTRQSPTPIEIGGAKDITTSPRVFLVAKSCSRYCHWQACLEGSPHRVLGRLQVGRDVGRIFAAGCNSRLTGGEIARVSPWNRVPARQNMFLLLQTSQMMNRVCIKGPISRLARGIRNGESPTLHVTSCANRSEKRVSCSRLPRCVPGCETATTSGETRRGSYPVGEGISRQ